MLRGFSPPWARHPFFRLVSGFPFQITWPPVPWARDPFSRLVSGFPPQITWLPVPWARHPIFRLVRGFPPQITRLPVPWARDPIVHLVRAFPPQITWLPVPGTWLPLAPTIPLDLWLVPMTTSRPIKCLQLSTNQKPPFGPCEPPSLLANKQILTNFYTIESPLVHWISSQNCDGL